MNSKDKLLKTIQATAVLVRLEQGLIDRIRLLNLLYIADRESWAECAHPIVGGYVVAAPCGPIHLDIFRLTQSAECDDRVHQWEEYFENERHTVASNFGTDPGRLKLCEYDIIKLNEVGNRYSGTDSWSLAELTRKFGEYKSCYVEGRREIIPRNEILFSLGYVPEEVARIEDDISESREMDKLFAEVTP